jgi:hypothetical protein
VRSQRRRAIFGCTPLPIPSIELVIAGAPLGAFNQSEARQGAKEAKEAKEAKVWER